MKGRITKGVGGFYEVDSAEGVYTCRARGLFRKQGIRPLVGDEVSFTVTHEADREGSIEEIFPRHSTLVRPAVANADLLLLVVAAASPDPADALTDACLAVWLSQGLHAAILLNKADLAPPETVSEFCARYSGAGFLVRVICARTGEGIDEVLPLLSGHICVAAGASGVGKSTLMNRLRGCDDMETGAVGKKNRGKHTTRFSRLLPVPRAGPDSYLVDTPGFSDMALPEELLPEQLGILYPEMSPILSGCRFAGCTHRREPDCAVRKAVEDGAISPRRYATYLRFYEELAARNRY